MKLVMIDWEDSSAIGHGVWHDVAIAKSDNNKDALLCRSVGWLLVDTKDSKVIVAHQSFGGPDGLLNQISGDMIIPTSAIRKYTILSKK